MAESVRCRSCGGVLAFGRQASTSGSSSDHCASHDLIPPVLERGKRKPASLFKRRQALEDTKEGVSVRPISSAVLLILDGLQRVPGSVYVLPAARGG
jgi:hypothetical protein